MIQNVTCVRRCRQLVEDSRGHEQLQKSNCSRHRNHTHAIDSTHSACREQLMPTHKYATETINIINPSNPSKSQQHNIVRTLSRQPKRSFRNILFLKRRCYSRPILWYIWTTRTIRWGLLCCHGGLLDSQNDRNRASGYVKKTDGIRIVWKTICVVPYGEFNCPRLGVTTDRWVLPKSPFFGEQLLLGIVNVRRATCDVREYFSCTPLYRTSTSGALPTLLRPLKNNSMVVIETETFLPKYGSLIIGGAHCI